MSRRSSRRRTNRRRDLARLQREAHKRRGRRSERVDWAGALFHPYRTVQIEAAVALGRTGDVGAVAPLGDWARRNLSDREIQVVARHAIVAIQSRIPGAAPGELSVVSLEGGELSLVEKDRRGEVSLEADEEAQSS